MSRKERVRRAVEIGYSPDEIGAALDRIEAKLAKRDRDKAANFFGNKEERKQIQMLRDAARKTLGYTRSDRLPLALRHLIAGTEVPEMLGELCGWCEIVLSKKLTPKRDDAPEKLLAAEEALLLRPQSLSEAQTKQWHKVTAILFGTGKIADVRSACRTFRKRLPGQLEATKTRLVQLRARLSAAAEKLEKLRRREFCQRG